MWFNSFDFAVFFCIVLALYWVLSHRWQNLMLLAASYFFYGYWDWRFLSLIFFSTVVDYIAGLRMQRAIEEGGPQEARRKRFWLVVSMVKSLGLLGFFKYYNFFTGPLSDALAPFGIDASLLHLDIVLPVGISFYTFQTMSYTIDIYRGVMKPTRRFFDFALFVSFFPQLVAGPIERASALLPQILGKRRFRRAQFCDGLHLMFWGLFEKVFVADNLARFVNQVFDSPDPSAFAVLCGVWAFAFQIYCDFAGYSHIARGCAKCMGFELRLNFNMPYIAANPREFWARWHISLSTWLRDYLYISLGGNRKGKVKTYRNLALTMFLGGLWHGAAWNFVLWGVYHGALLIIHRLFEPVLKCINLGRSRVLAAVWRVARIIIMFHLVCLGWVFFRARSMDQIYLMLGNVLKLRGAVDLSLLQPLALYALPLVLAETMQRLFGRDGALGTWGSFVWLKCIGYALLAYLLVYYGASASSFIYFQF